MASSAPQSGAIVIVEDEQHIGLVFKRIMHHLAPNLDVILATHGAGALIQIESRFVPLVITDYVMPDMNGVEVTREVKRRSPNTCVIAITAYSDDHTRQAFIAAGVDYFFEKPVSLERLSDTVQHVLSTQGGVPGRTP